MCGYLNILYKKILWDLLQVGKTRQKIRGLQNLVKILKSWTRRQTGSQK